MCDKRMITAYPSGRIGGVKLPVFNNALLLKTKEPNYFSTQVNRLPDIQLNAFSFLLIQKLNAIENERDFRRSETYREKAGRLHGNSELVFRTADIDYFKEGIRFLLPDTLDLLQASLTKKLAIVNVTIDCKSGNAYKTMKKPEPDTLGKPQSGTLP